MNATAASPALGVALLRGRDRLEPVMLAFLLAAVCALAFTAYTARNGFAVTTHVDEMGKVIQIQSGHRNCWHPLLLLTATDGVLWFRGGVATAAEIVHAGRSCSAAFAALAVAGIGLVAWRLRGRAAGLLAALLGATHPQLYEAAHFMKEDTGLLMGIVFSILGIVLVREQRGPWAAVLLGAANALAVSGKYAGVFMIPVSLLALGGRPRQIVAYVFALLATIAAVNLPALPHVELIGGGVGREWEYMVRGHHGVTRTVPHLVYLETFLRLVSAPLIALALFGAVRAALARRTDGWLIAVGAGYAIMLSFFPKTADRYLLPVVAITCYFAAAGALDLAAWISRRWTRRPMAQWPILAAVVILAFSIQVPLLLRYRSEFGRDSRMELARWILEELPADSMVGWGIWAQLPDVDGRSVRHPQVPTTTFSPVPDYAADFGTVAELPTLGIGYVAVARPEYYAFASGAYFSEGKAGEEFQRRKRFYEELRAQGELVWEQPPGRVQNLHPGLQLFRLPWPARVSTARAR